MDINECSTLCEYNVDKVFEYLYKVFSSDLKLTLKMHNLTHYPWNILRHKLLPVNFSCIRFEGVQTREDSEYLENEERERPESILNNDVLREVIEANPRATIREIARELNVSKSTFYRQVQEVKKQERLTDRYLINLTTTKN
uniref:HTH domain-containing protein n=1 Tax=Strongyloides venezuelensis TaxID=75913 RepID=A0A0K0FS63_STRVS